MTSRGYKQTPEHRAKSAASARAAWTTQRRQKAAAAIEAGLGGGGPDKALHLTPEQRADYDRARHVLGAAVAREGLPAAVAAREYGCPMSVAELMVGPLANRMLTAIRNLGPKRCRWLGMPGRSVSGLVTAWSLDGKRVTEPEMVKAAGPRKSG